MTKKTGPLIGFRALDLIEELGSYGPKLFVSLGAEVIRIEPPGGSGARTRSPLSRRPRNGDTVSLDFLHYNAGKKAVSLNLQDERGRELLARLLDRVDVVFDNGQLSSLGFDPDALARKSPPLVIVSVTPFGLGGPRSSWQADDLVCQAMSGMISYFGYRNERPARFGPHQASEIAGLAACLGALIALFGARRSGRGDVIDIAVERVGALVTLQMSNASLYHQFGFIRKRHERGSGELTLYSASDGYVQMGAFRSLTPLLAVLEKAGEDDGLRDLAASQPDEEFTRNPHVGEVIGKFCGSRTRWEVAATVQAQGVMCVPINDVADLMIDPFLQNRGFFAEVSAEALHTPLKDAATPMRFARTPLDPGRVAPGPGKDNEDVFGSLGLGEADIETLRAEGVV